MSHPTTEFPVQAGDIFEVVQLGPCVGGKLRTWTVDGEALLWSTPDAEWLLDHQATGQISRTLREEDRYREVAMLDAATGTLIVARRHTLDHAGIDVQVDAQVVRLEHDTRPAHHIFDDFDRLLAAAVAHCVSTGEFLVVELGGWDAPETPYCLFIAFEDDGEAMSVIETSPSPREARLWKPVIIPGEESAQMSAKATPDTLGVVPMLMSEAIFGWGVTPWDVAFTFGVPSETVAFPRRPGPWDEPSTEE